MMTRLFLLIGLLASVFNQGLCQSFSPIINVGTSLPLFSAAGTIQSSVGMHGGLALSWPNNAALNISSEVNYNHYVQGKADTDFNAWNYGVSLRFDSSGIGENVSLYLGWRIYDYRLRINATGEQNEIVGSNSQWFQHAPFLGVTKRFSNRWGMSIRYSVLLKNSFLTWVEKPIRFIDISATYSFGVFSPKRAWTHNYPIGFYADIRAGSLLYQLFSGRKYEGMQWSTGLGASFKTNTYTSFFAELGLVSWNNLEAIDTVFINRKIEQSRSLYLNVGGSMAIPFGENKAIMARAGVSISDFKILREGSYSLDSSTSLAQSYFLQLGVAFGRHFEPYVGYSKTGFSWLNSFNKLNSTGGSTRNIHLGVRFKI